jgi:hypothetical protein
MSDSQPVVNADVSVQPGCPITARADASAVVLEIGGRGFGDAPVHLTFTESAIDELISAATAARDRMHAKQRLD